MAAANWLDQVPSEPYIPWHASRMLVETIPVVQNILTKDKYVSRVADVD